MNTEKSSLIKKYLIKGMDKNAISEIIVDYTDDDNILYSEELPIFDISEETIKELCDKFGINCVGFQNQRMMKEKSFVGVFIDQDSFKIICSLKIKETKSNADLKRFVTILRIRIREIRESLLHELSYAA
jgi:hypothetical protein